MRNPTRRDPARKDPARKDRARKDRAQNGRGLRIREVVTEALLDIRLGGGTMRVQAVILLTLLLGVAIAEATFIDGLLDLKSSRQHRGEDVMVVVAPDSSTMTVGDCEALRTLPGVQRTAAVTSEAIVSLPVMGDARLVGFEGSPDLATIWSDGADGSTAPQVVGAMAADRLGIGSQADLGWEVRTETEARTTAVLPTTRVADFARQSEAEGWVVLHSATPSQRFSECWVEAEPGMGTAVGDVARFALSTSESVPVVRPLFRVVDGTSEDLGQQMSARPTRWGWMAAAVLWTALMAIQQILARRRLALYVSLGVSRGELVTIAMVRQALLVLLVGTVAVVGVAAAFLVRVPPGLGQEVVEAATAQAALFGLATIAAAPLTMAVLARMSVVEALRD